MSRIDKLSELNYITIEESEADLSYVWKGINSATLWSCLLTTTLTNGSWLMERKLFSFTFLLYY